MLGNAVVSTAAATAEIDRRTKILGDESATFADRVKELDADAPLIVPPPYLWTAMAVVVLIVVTIIAVLVVWWWVIPQRTKSELPAVLADYPGATDTDARARQVAKSRALASLTDMGVTLIGGVALTAVVVMAVLARCVPLG